MLSVNRDVDVGSRVARRKPFHSSWALKTYSFTPRKPFPKHTLPATHNQQPPSSIHLGQTLTPDPLQIPHSSPSTSTSTNAQTQAANTLNSPTSRTTSSVNPSSSEPVCTTCARKVSRVRLQGIHCDKKMVGNELNHNAQVLKLSFWHSVNRLKRYRVSLSFRGTRMKTRCPSRCSSMLRGSL